MSNIDTKKKIESLAKTLEFKLSNEELTKIENEYHEIENSLALIKEMDTTNVQPTNFIFDFSKEPKWREDNEETYDPKSVFKNCKDFKNNMVEIKNEK